MKIGRIIWIVVILLLLVVGGILLFYPDNLVKDQSSEKAFSHSSLDEQERAIKQAEAFTETLNAEGGFFEQVQMEMKANGYESMRVMGMIYAQDDLRLKILLPGREANEKEQQEVQEIFTEVILQNGMDPNSFEISVSNDGEWK